MRLEVVRSRGATYLVHLDTAGAQILIASPPRTEYFPALSLLHVAALPEKIRVHLLRIIGPKERNFQQGFGTSSLEDVFFRDRRALCDEESAESVVVFALPELL